MKVPVSAYEADTQTPSLAACEQVETMAFQAQPRDPCQDGHLWERHGGELECQTCGELVDAE